MKRYLMTTLMLSATLTKRFFRDPVALFFTFLFPLLFLFIFGSLFRSTDVSFKVALLDNADSKFAHSFVEQFKKNDVFKIKDDIKTYSVAKEKMGQGEIDSILELPKDFGELDANGVPKGQVTVYYEEASPQTGQTVAGVMQQVLDEVNKNLTPARDPLTVEQKATKTSNLTRFDYTFAGLVGFSIMSLAIFGMANGFPADKKTGSLRRLRASPLRASQLVLATALEYLLISLMTIVMMLIVAMLLFDFHMRGNYLYLGIYSILGTFCMFGFGLAIGGWAKNENQSAPLSNLIAFPLMFLSGVFFPVFLMPEWLQNIARLLPLTPIIDGIRLITTEHASLFSLGFDLAVIGGWIIIIYALAFKLFRWE